MRLKAQRRGCMVRDGLPVARTVPDSVMRAGSTARDRGSCSGGVLHRRAWAGWRGSTWDSDVQRMPSSRPVGQQDVNYGGHRAQQRRDALLSREAPQRPGGREQGPEERLRHHLQSKRSIFLLALTVHGRQRT